MTTLSKSQILSVLIVLAVAITFGTVGIASATLTIGATSLTTDGAYTVTSVAGSTVNMFAANVAGVITIGGTAQTGNFNIGVSSATMAMNIATGDGAKTVTIANGTGIDTIVIGGGGTAADNIDIGDALADVDITGASGIVAGTGDALTITGNAASTWSTSAGALTITSASALTLGDALTGTDAATVAIFSSDWEISTAGAMTGIGAITLDGAITGGTSGTFSTFVAADAYRVTNGTTITATGAVSKANLQAASYFLVDTTGATAVAVTLGAAGESFDAGDIGRTLLFGHGTNTGAVTVVANDTLTVATVAAAGAAVDLAGDYIECKVLTATLVTCASFAQ